VPGASSDADVRLMARAFFLPDRLHRFLNHRYFSAPGALSPDKGDFSKWRALLQT
jgi:hypothetical protein